MLTADTTKIKHVNSERFLLREDSHTRRLHDALRGATAAMHSSAHRHPVFAVLMKDELTEQNYRRALRALYSFYRPVDATLQAMLAHHFPVEAKKYKLASRHEWLLADLVRYDDMPDLHCNKTSEDVVSDACLKQKYLTPAAVIGYLYVVEGSALGGKFISQRVRQTLGSSPRISTHFFDGLGAQTSAQWQSFWDFAGENCLPDEIDTAAKGAVGLFELLHQQMDAALKEERHNAS